MLSRHSRISHNSPPFVTNLFQAWSDGVGSPTRLERFLDDLYGRTRFRTSAVTREALGNHLRLRPPLAFRDLAVEAVAAHSAIAGKRDFIYWADKTPAFVSVLRQRMLTLASAIAKMSAM